MAFGVPSSANLLIKLTVGGNYKSALSNASKQLRQLDKDATRGYKAGVQIGTGIKRGAILATAGLGVLGAALAKSVGAAGDFEAQLNTINTIAFKNADGLKAIGDGIRDIARKTGLTLDDLTSSYYDLLSAGVKVSDAQAVLNDAVTLGIGGLATTTEAVDLLTTAYNAYGLDAKGAAIATDQFAQAVADGKVKASEIASTFANVASIAKSYNIGIDQIAASYGFLTAQGVPAAEVTTEMNRAIISLIKPSKELSKAQKDLGVNFTDVVKKKGLVPALDILRKYSDKTGIPLISLLGRVEAVKYALQTTGPNAKGFADELTRIRDSSGEAAKQMAERQQGLNFQIARLKALAKDAGITIGSALLPKLTPAVEAINKLINDSQPQIAAFGQTLADSFTTQGVVDGIKALADGFSQMVELAKVAAGPVKAIVSAFLSLPKEVQTVLIGAFAVNKLTGGLVTNAAGGIVESLGKAFIGGIKTPLVNVNGGVVNVNGGIPGAGGASDLLPAAGAAGIGVGTGTALGLIAGSAIASYVAATDYASSHIAPLQDKGLTRAEILAQQYYTGDTATQQQILKHTGQLPTKADYDSGTAKLANALKPKSLTSLDKLQRTKDASSNPFGASVKEIKAAAVALQKAATAERRAAIKRAPTIQKTGAAHDRETSASIAKLVLPAPKVNVKTGAVSTAVNIKVNVTASGIHKTVTVQQRYGPATGSRNSSARQLEGFF